MSSDRRLTGKYVTTGLGDTPQTWQANAYGHGPGDRRKVRAKMLGLETAPTPRNVSLADATDGEADLADLKLGVTKLTRGKLAAMSASLRGGVKTGEGFAPITVADGVVLDGKHRVAVMQLEGRKGKIPVKLIGKKQEARKAMKMPTKAEMEAMSEADLKKLDKEMHDAGEEKSDAHGMLAGVCKEKGCDMPCAEMDKAGKITPTEEQVGLGISAARQAAGGKNPPGFAADEDTWAKAKKAAAKTYDESDDAYWPAVVAIYQNMGGTIKSAAKKQLTKADLGLSLYQIESKIREAVRKKWGSNTSMRDIYPDDSTVVFSVFPPWDGMTGMVTQTDVERTYWCEYEIDDDGAVTLGDWEEVEQAREWVPVAKALGGTQVIRWLGAAMARLDGTPSTLAVTAGVSQSVVTGLLNGTVAHLGSDDAKALAQVLEVEVDELHAALGEALVAAAEIPPAERPERENVLDETTVMKAVEYRARHTGCGEFLVDGLNGDRDALVKALNRTFGMHAVVLRNPDSLRVSVERYQRESPQIGAELLIKADIRYEADAADEPDARTLPFLGAPAELRKAAEQGILYAVAYAPGDETTPDLQGEWTDAEEIRKAAHAYLTKHRVVKRQHDGAATDDQIVESYIAPQDLTINKTLVKSGSWVVGIKLGSESKKLVKAGKMRGISIGGTKRIVAA